jgi:hypothetical protein
MSQLAHEGREKRRQAVCAILCLCASTAAMGVSCSQTPSSQEGSQVFSQWDDKVARMKRLNADGLFFNLEHVNQVVQPAAGTVVPVARSGNLTLSGWAIDPVARNAAGGVLVIIDGKVHAAEYGIGRGDVASAFKTDACLKSGFTLSIPANSLSVGRHTIVVHVMNVAQDGVYPGFPIVVDIT